MIGTEDAVTLHRLEDEFALALDAAGVAKTAEALGRVAQTALLLLDGGLRPPTWKIVVMARLLFLDDFESFRPRVKRVAKRKRRKS